MEIPLDDIGLKEKELSDFIVIDGAMGRGIGAYPRDMLISIERDSSALISAT